MLRGVLVEGWAEFVSSVDKFLKVMREHDTATAALIAWCRRHHPYEAEAIAITLLADETVAADCYDGPLQPRAGERYAAAGLAGAGATVCCRKLRTGMPERLPPAMRDAIADGVRPYGAVVASLRPQRITTDCAARR